MTTQQSSGTWQMVVGAFGDYDFASLKGTVSEPFFPAYGYEKMDYQWSAGGRIGVLVTPSLLTYFSAGYTEAHFNGFNLFNGSLANGPLGFAGLLVTALPCMALDRTRRPGRGDVVPP